MRIVTVIPIWLWPILLPFVLAFWIVVGFGYVLVGIFVAVRMFVRYLINRKKVSHVAAHP